MADKATELGFPEQLFVTREYDGKEPYFLPCNADLEGVADGAVVAIYELQRTGHVSVVRELK